MTDKPTLQERYRVAANSGGDADAVGAFGLADRRLTDGWVPTGKDEGYDIRKAPLAVALERLFGGDNHAAHRITELMAEMVFQHSWKLKIRISRVTALDLSRAVLAWHRDGRCRPCKGHGFELVPGAARPTLSDRICPACGGTTKLPLDKIVAEESPKLVVLARWLVCEVERESGRAAPEAMKALAQRMNLV